ncbi:MAG: hypothetical protein DRP16_04230 [Candidatus Aenigmatarchaeota archaeon]|nr:MAG: hypothetical protein DRP16_04230 [Candidatus Aenigmarchaeota archaeon]
MEITKTYNPSFIVAGTNESIDVRTDVKLTNSNNPVYMINITDEIPYDFAPPENTSVNILFIDYSPYQIINITGNATVTVNVTDLSGTNNTLLIINISNISQTDANGYMETNDTIRIEYQMVSSQMDPGENRTLYTNATLTDTQSSKGSDWINTTLNCAAVVLRGDKTIWIPDLSNPQNLSVKIVIKSLGGTVTDISLADYLPAGVEIKDLNVTYYNYTSGTVSNLYNGSDYYVADPMQTTLPDGTYADVYHYNFSYAFTNWDGNLYENDNITLEYNITVLGGGEWKLPAIISGYDPQYKKHIRTEMYASANVPSFDVMLEILTDTVFPGEPVKALLRIVNVGGPRAKVDVYVDYSAKTLKGETIVEKSETIAVVEQKEKSLELVIPEKIKPGVYVFESYVTYTGREALSTETFKVEGVKEKGFIEKYGLYILMLIIIIVLLVMYLRATKTQKIAAVFLFLLLLQPVVFAQFNASLEIITKNPQPGNTLKALLKINNQNYTGLKTNVVVTSAITGDSGYPLIEKTSTYPVSDSRDILLKFKLPEDMQPGSYILSTRLLFPENKTETLHKVFNIKGSEDFGYLFLILALLAVLTVFIKRK